jgi:hypothetical protein
VCFALLFFHPVTRECTAGGAGKLVTSIKRLLVGRAKRTEQAIHERLTKKTGLAVFASDALSSTAYATEEILLVLAVAAAAGQSAAYRYVSDLNRYRSCTRYRRDQLSPNYSRLPIRRWGVYRG